MKEADSRLEAQEKLTQIHIKHCEFLRGALEDHHKRFDKVMGYWRQSISMQGTALVIGVLAGVALCTIITVMYLGY
jgi:hypothetical protein